MAKAKKAQETAEKRAYGLTIGVKLITMIAALLMGSAALLLYVFTTRFTENSVGLVKELSNTTAASISNISREYFLSTIERAKAIGSLLMDKNAQVDPVAFKQHIISQYFDSNSDLIAVYLHKKEGTQPISLGDTVLAQEIVAGGDAQGTNLWNELSKDREFSLETVMSKEDQQVSTVRLGENSLAIVVSVPFLKVEHSGTFTSYTVTAFIKQSHLNNVMVDYPQTTNFIVDSKGRLLAHSEAERAIERENVSHLQIVKDFLSGKSANEETEYEDTEKDKPVTFLGAFHTIGFARLGVVSQSPREIATSNVTKVVKIAQGIAIAVLFIAFMSGYLYSGTITRPIKGLVEASEKIRRGEFKIELPRTSRDEMAELALAFKDMAHGLEERDRFKETFHKFHNAAIAEKLLSGEVKLGGERKMATVLFSDVRGFTSMSEQMEPEAVVEMLNEYLTCMVSVILAHHGVIDKYIGDAIMALWGVPLSTSSDAENAVKAAIAMRQALAQLNEIRKARGQSVLHIGIGINSGPLIAGQIGSEDKMEYTVIGDTVNVASRIESITKEYGTDLLISKNVLNQVSDKFITEPCQSIKVKGKSQALEVFKVKGTYDASGRPEIQETPYSSYQPEKSDKTGFTKIENPKMEVSPVPKVPQFNHAPEVVENVVKSEVPQFKPPQTNSMEVKIPDFQPLDFNSMPEFSTLPDFDLGQNQPKAKPPEAPQPPLPTPPQTNKEADVTYQNLSERTGSIDITGISLEIKPEDPPAGTPTKLKKAS